MSTVDTFVKFIDWQAPTPMPDDGTEYVWDEAALLWQPIPTETGNNQ